MIDIFTVLPIWLTYIFFPGPISYDQITTFTQGFNYALRAAYTLRILRALRLHKRCSVIDDEVDRFLAQMLLQVITMIFFGAY